MSFWENIEWPVDATLASPVKLTQTTKNHTPQWLFNFSRQHQAGKKALKSLHIDVFDKLLPRYVHNTDIRDIYKDYDCTHDLVGTIYKGDIPTSIQIEALLYFYQKYLTSFKTLEADVAIAASFLFGVALANSLSTELHPKDYATLLPKTPLRAFITHFWERIPEHAKNSANMQDYLSDLKRAHVPLI